MADQNKRLTEQQQLEYADYSVVIDDITVIFKTPADKASNGTPGLKGVFTGSSHKEVKALQNVSLKIKRGEAVGVIGSNGSGKSTLMRVISGLEEPTSGRVFAESRPTLLSIGASLIPELSGTKNVILGCLAMGLSLSEAKELSDGIIEFADIGEAIHLPMRTYSSGMMARLKFAIITAISHDVLIIDEALAVGDNAFYRKSMARVEELTASAGTVFFVSHSMNAIKANCNRAFWLNKGVLEADGTPEEVIAKYEASQK